MTISNKRVPTAQIRLISTRISIANGTIYRLSFLKTPIFIIMEIPLSNKVNIEKDINRNQELEAVAIRNNTMNDQFFYETGSRELPDEIEPLWEQLRAVHQKVSTHFAEEFQKAAFSTRKENILKQYGTGKIKIDLARATDSKEVIGYCMSAIDTEGTGEILSIIVEESFRCHKIGDQLMKKSLTWMDEQKVKQKIVSVAEGNERAWKFYARYGFYPRLSLLVQK